MSRNQWVQECHLMFKNPYMVIKIRCVWNKTFPLGQFMLHFTTFIMFLYTYTLPCCHAFQVSEFRSFGWMEIVRASRMVRGRLRLSRSACPLQKQCNHKLYPGSSPASGLVNKSWYKESIITCIHLQQFPNSKAACVLDLAASLTF